MGISNNAIKCFFYARKQGIRFKSILTLGRQHMFADERTLDAIAGSFGEAGLVKNLRFPDKFAEPLYRALGAEVMDGMDVSTYEGANVIHDMNQPIPGNLNEQYDLVFDGGTLEHVFNFPQAIKNAMQMVKPGGHFMAVNPCNNQLGHGFYQFSPELFFRIMSEENGFRIIKIFLSKDGSDGKFYEVKDPHEVHGRVTLINDDETSMIVIAQRVAVVEIFKNTPQQSDYASTWKENEEAMAGGHQSAGMKAVYQRMVPASVRAKIWKARYDRENKKKWSSDLGKYNPQHFIKTDI